MCVCGGGIVVNYLFFDDKITGETPSGFVTAI